MTIEELIAKYRNDPRFAQIAQNAHLIPDQKMQVGEWAKKHGELLNNPAMPAAVREVIGAEGKTKTAANARPTGVNQKTMLFLHGMQSRYGKTSPAKVEADARKYAESRGMNFEAIPISGDKRQAQFDAANKRLARGDVGAVLGFSAGGYNAARLKTPQGVEKIIVGAPRAKGNQTFPGRHMDQVSGLTRQPSAKQIAPPQKLQAGEQPPRPPRDIPFPVAQGRNIGYVDPRLKNILSPAISSFEQAHPGYKVEAFSGSAGRSGGGFHPSGRAVDLQITGPQGQILNRGSDPTGLYHELARTAYGFQQAKYPDLKGRFAWGGAFGTQKPSGGPPDLMHFDIGGERGHFIQNRLSKLGPLPGVDYGSGRVQTASIPQTQPQSAPSAQPPIPPSRPDIPVTPAVNKPQSAFDKPPQKLFPPDQPTFQDQPRVPGWQDSTTTPIQPPRTRNNSDQSGTMPGKSPWSTQDTPMTTFPHAPGAPYTTSLEQAIIAQRGIPGPLGGQAPQPPGQVQQIRPDSVQMPVGGDAPTIPQPMQLPVGGGGPWGGAPFGAGFMQPPIAPPPMPSFGGGFGGGGLLGGMGGGMEGGGGGMGGGGGGGGIGKGIAAGAQTFMQMMPKPLKLTPPPPVNAFAGDNDFALKLMQFLQG